MAHGLLHRLVSLQQLIEQQIGGPLGGMKGDHPLPFLRGIELTEVQRDKLGGQVFARLAASFRGELTAINPGEAVEEKVSLSDRFGLWLGFHPCTQDEYLAMIRGYCDAYGLVINSDSLRAEAIEWQATRGARSGRVAWQFFTDLAGRSGKAI